MELLRISREGDEKELFSLWKTVFGDSEACISDFFSHMYSPGRASCLETGGRIVSMAFSLPLGDLVDPGGLRTPCSYVYAVATLPEYRSMGYGSLVTRAAVENGGISQASVLRPAVPSLFGYYRKSVGLEDFFLAAEQRFSTDASAVSPRGSCERIALSDYFELREAMLKDIVHVCFSERAMLYQEHLCASSGGGLFRLHMEGGDGLFASEKHNGEVHVKELLCGAGDEDTALALITSAHPDERIINVRKPARSSDYSNYFAMITPSVNISKGGNPPWLGFAFD